MSDEFEENIEDICRCNLTTVGSHRFYQSVFNFCGCKDPPPLVSGLVRCKLPKDMGNYEAPWASNPYLKEHCWGTRTRSVSSHGYT